MKKFGKVLSIFLAMVLVFSMAACSSSGQGAGGASAGQSSAQNAAGDQTGSEPVTLTMYTYNGSPQESLDYFDDIIGKFESENPGVTIELILTEDPTGLSTQQLAAGGGPDILTVEPTSIQLFADAKYITELDHYAAEYGWDDLFDEWGTDTTSRDGHLMGIPGAIDGLVVYYNKTMFDENGWQVPENYQQFVSLCDSAKAAGKIPLTFGSSDFKMANQWWLSMVYSVELGQKRYRDLLQGDLRWDSDEVRQATQRLMDMWTNGYIYENSAGITLDDARNLFINEQAVMTMSGQWEIETLIESEPEFEWAAFKMPAWNDGIEAPLPVAIGETFAINANCKNPDMAAKFLNEFFNDEAIMKRLRIGVLYPTSNSDPSALTDIDHHYVDVYEIMLDAMESGNIGYCAWTYWPPNVDTYAWNNLESLYLGQLSLDEYVKNLQSSYEEDVERNNVLKF